MFFFVNASGIVVNVCFEFRWMSQGMRSIFFKQLYHILIVNSIVFLLQFSTERWIKATWRSATFMSTPQKNSGITFGYMQLKNCQYFVFSKSIGLTSDILCTDYSQKLHMVSALCLLNQIKVSLRRIFIK